MNQIFTWSIARLLEPSTWAGIAIIATDIQKAVTDKNPTELLVGLAGVLAVVVPEGSAASKALPKK